MLTTFNLSYGDELTRLKIKGDRIIVERLDDMSEEMKNIVIDFYTELTGENPSRIRNFLDFTNDENEFCS